MAQLLLANFIHAIYSYFIVSSFSDTAVPLSQINNTLILQKMASNNERSFIMIKPDGVHRGLVGEIIKRFEAKGFKLVAMKFMTVSIITVSPYTQIMVTIIRTIILILTH